MVHTIAARKCFGHARQKGAEIVEFLITLPIILIVAALIYDFGALLSDQIILTEAARAAAREVIRSPIDESHANVVAAAQQASDQVAGSLLDYGTTSLPTVTVQPTVWPVTEGAQVTVTVNHVFPFYLLPGFASTAADFNISATARMNMLTD